MIPVIVRRHLQCGGPVLARRPSVKFPGNSSCSVASALVGVLLILVGIAGATDSTAANGADVIRVSVSDDRSDARPLDSARLYGRVAVFVDDLPRTRSVQFSVDGAVVSTEQYRPFDLARTSAGGKANLYDLRELTPGAHKFRAVRAFTDGSPDRVLEATFIVDANPRRQVTVCGTRLCLDGWPWRVNGGSTNGSPSDGQTPDGNFSLAQDLKLNTVRLTDFIRQPGRLGVGEYDPQRWADVDQMIARAAQGNLKVELDLSTYRNFLASQSPTFNPYTYDWTPFLTFVANRTNTVTGQRYGSDPTIAFVAFAGETEAPDHTDSLRRGVTKQQLISFYDSAMTLWGTLAPGQIRIPGGMLFLNEQNMPWREIFSLKSCDLPAMHSYSAADERSMPVLSAFASDLGKPWFLEEFGFDTQDYPTDLLRAAAFNRQQDLALAAGAAGVAFWNLDRPTLEPTTAPLTAAAIRARNTGLAALR